MNGALTFLLIAALAAVAPARASAAPLDPTRWMAQVPGGLRLSQITMPGTHDSGALEEPSALRGTTQAQNLSIRNQLYVGVRFLDIRLNYKNGELRVNHGLIQQPDSFDRVLSYCYDFLASHPTETVVMSIKEEVPTGSHSYPWTFERIVSQKIAAQRARWYDGKTIPTLAAVRGKIVLVRRFADGKSGYSGGIDARTWPGNTTGDAGSQLHVEDHYNLGDHINDASAYEGKYRECTAHMWAAASTNPSRLYLTFTSGTFMHLFDTIPRRDSIPKLARYMNPRIRTYVTPWMGHFGTTAMDFIDAGTAREIIDTNGRWR